MLSAFVSHHYFTLVPIFDAREHFTSDSKKLSHAFDLYQAIISCPVTERELEEGDVVAVVHSIFWSPVSGVDTLLFGVYYVVLIATAPA